MATRLATLVLLVIVGSCANASVEEGTPHAVTGVVVGVVGDLAQVESFTLRINDGTDLVMNPAEGVLFGGSAPLSHLRSHLLNGEPVTVTYLSTSHGVNTALSVGDSPQPLETGSGEANS